MKLGLITDIHEQVEPLQTALRQFDQQNVDQVVVIGDVMELGERLDETCRLLASAAVVGVWGNHDFGICSAPTEEERARYSATTLDFLTSLQPRLEVGGCRFSHVEPWLNPEKLEDLWFYDGPPDQHGKLRRIFDAAEHHVMFAGHYHKWLLATPERIEDWDGKVPVRLAPEQRYFVVIAALCDGHYAIYDTEQGELQPFTDPTARGRRLPT